MTDPSRRLDERYELGAPLGRGGMADVVRAHDRVLRRDVAVKLLREVGELDRERFASEARLLAMLNHPNIVTVLDAGVDGARPWLLLELVDGEPLDEVLAQGPVEAHRLARIGAQLADALAHAHLSGVVHRDVKPSNVLVAAGDQVKLTDFGIARLAGSEASLTLTGQTIGTAAYLAPEQVTGGPIGPAVDVYALGLVLLEALTGRREYDGPAVEAALARLHRSPLVPTSLPTGWPGLISTMTATQPTDRPSASQVADRIRSLGASASQPAQPASTTTELVAPTAGERRTRRRTPVVAAVVALTGLVLAVGVWVSRGSGDERAAATGSPTSAEAVPRPSPTDTPSATQRAAANSSAATTTRRSSSPVRHQTTGKAHTAPKHKRKAHKQKHKHKGHGHKLPKH